MARWWNGQEVTLSGHALADPAPLLMSSRRARTLPDTLSRLGIAGGAVYDALVALAAV